MRFRSPAMEQKTTSITYLKLLAVLVFAVSGLLACSEGKAKRRGGITIADSKSYEASLFRQNCAICHGAEADGKMIDGKMVPSLRFGEAAKKSEEEIYQQIRHGKLPMPAFENQLTDEEIRRMVKFIRRDLQGKE